MGNDISSFCNCTDSKVLTKYEHLTKPVENPETPSNRKNNLSLHKSLERVKQKYESNSKTKNLPTIMDIEESERTINYEDGSTYTGEVKNDKRNGKGKLVFKNSNLYEGEFKDDMMNGYGRFEDKDFIYEGYFINDKKNGEGTETNKLGSYKYEGQWKDNMKNGIGKELLPDKSRYEGIYVNGKKSGKGILYLSNGSIYDGELQNDKLEGHVL
jgi:hypothetical protein